MQKSAQQNLEIIALDKYPMNLLQSSVLIHCYNDWMQGL